MKTVTIQTILHFPKDGLGGDYSDVEVLLDGELLETFGDEYHEKGLTSSQSFVTGFITGFPGKVEVLPRIEVDDREDF